MPTAVRIFLQTLSLLPSESRDNDRLSLGSSWHQPLLTPVLSPQASKLAFPSRNLVTPLTHPDGQSSGPGAQVPTPQRGLRAPCISVHQSCGFLSTPEIQALSPPGGGRPLLFTCCFPCLTAVLSCFYPEPSVLCGPPL